MFLPTCDVHYIAILRVHLIGYPFEITNPTVCFYLMNGIHCPCTYFGPELRLFCTIPHRKYMVHQEL